MWLWMVLACTAGSPSGEDDDGGGDDTGGADARGPWLTPPPSVIDMPDRLVGFADVHGDYDAAVDVLQFAGLIDDDLAWVGGEAVAVQTGDQLDRGDGERRILDLFERISEEAWDAGGGFYPLVGNHETMNVELDLRYVTDGGFDEFDDIPYDDDDPLLADYPSWQRGRVAAFRPGGPYAMVLAGHNMVMQVGDTVFVHGGVLPDHAEAGLETINAEVQAWMRDEGPEPDRWISGDAPVWTRVYSDDDEPPACSELEEALEILGAERMVVGHTIQDQANPACDGKVWRMDVGMAAYYGGTPAALVIEGEEATLLD